MEIEKQKETVELKNTRTGAPASSGRAQFGYEIRIKDHLETFWFEWFDGWTITNLANGEVLLARANVDQSALHGALNKIRDLNLLLLSVVRVPLDA